jgi:hypothetical protein
MRYEAMGLHGLLQAELYLISCRTVFKKCEDVTANSDAHDEREAKQYYCLQVLSHKVTDRYGSTLFAQFNA